VLFKNFETLVLELRGSRVVGNIISFLFKFWVNYWECICGGWCPRTWYCVKTKMANWENLKRSNPTSSIKLN
jgi:hypothetical protein